jgi:large subunit ribosomal protein L21
MTFAIIRSGGRQLKVSPDKQYLVPLMKAEPGDKIKITDILLYDNDGKVIVGTPIVPGILVNATVLNHGKLPKIEAMKYMRRKKYRRRWGHRVQFTKISIDSIKSESKRASKKTVEAEVKDGA